MMDLRMRSDQKYHNRCISLKMKLFFINKFRPKLVLTLGKSVSLAAYPNRLSILLGVLSDSSRKESFDSQKHFQCSKKCFLHQTKSSALNNSH